MAVVLRRKHGGYSGALVASSVHRRPRTTVLSSLRRQFANNTSTEEQAGENNDNNQNMIERLDPTERKPLSIVQRIREFPNGAKLLMRDFQVYQHIHDASRTPRNAWTTKKNHPQHQCELPWLHAKQFGETDESRFGMIPRRQYEQQRRIKLEAGIVPVFFLSMLPFIGYVPMILAFSAPRQILSRHFINQYEIYHFNELAYRQRKNHFAAVYKHFLHFLKLENLDGYMMSEEKDAAGRMMNSFELFSTLKETEALQESSFLDVASKNALVELALSFGVLQHLPPSLASQLAHWAPKGWLCRQIRNHIHVVTTDDALLLYEQHHLNGSKSVTDMEVMDACLVRGLPIDVSPEIMRICLTHHLKMIATLRDLHPKPGLFEESETFGLISVLLPVLRQAAIENR